MNKRLNRKPGVVVLWLILFSMTAVAAIQESPPPKVEMPITKWLLLGPFIHPLPAFHAEGRKAFTIEDLLKYDELSISELRPKLDRPMTWHDGSTAKWREVISEDSGIRLIESVEVPSSAYLAAYVEVSRFTLLKFTMISPQPFRCFLDGMQVKIKTSVNKNVRSENKTEGGSVTCDVKLETGKHLLLIETVYDPSSDSDWSIKARCSLQAPFLENPPTISTSPAGRMNIHHLLDGPKPVDISISPDGKLAALTIRRTLPPGDSSESWLELHDIEDDKLLHTYRGGRSLSRVQWAPVGRKFSYTSYGKPGGTIWVVDLEQGTTTPILTDMPYLGGHTWAPDGSFLIYSVTQEGPTDRPGIKRIVTMADRMPGWRNRSHLYKINLQSGARQKLTSGALSTSQASISPDGRRLLVTRSKVDLEQRPYSTSQLYVLDIVTLEAELLWEGPWLAGAQWVPDGKTILMLGGPSLFGEIGINIPTGTSPNEYDTQAYFFDPVEKKVEPLTKGFDPSINQAHFSLSENCIYFVVTEADFVHLYRYSPKSKEFEKMYCGVDALGSFSIARGKPMGVYIGSSATVPHKAFTIDLKRRRSSLFRDPSSEDFADVGFGELESWTYRNQRGRDIACRVYYPPRFDPKRKYPCIVNYYGGTSPVTRGFGGRYPLNYYAAQGYIVFVLQPSGATGFGQDFSGLHVNDWGQIVADEILDGVKKFTETHPFVDPARIGCIGASFGGFMTMLLQTRSSLFATAIAHAGISSIASYWGEGYWGYLYSAYATANSFPWNRKDLYIEQSPLFNADKISTPLLLLHGSADTNVPPGESTQLFTALKLLGREVEYIQILDQNHHIMEYGKRILWTKTILAWFDRWLKRQPQWWFDLYPIIFDNAEKTDDIIKKDVS